MLIDTVPAPSTESVAELVDLDRALSLFTDLRPRLLAVAQRILGNRVEAEDTVQDAWLRWQLCDRTVVVNPTAFLVTMVTRLALNTTDSARVRPASSSRSPSATSRASTSPNDAWNVERLT